jgi:hypothetical protein
MREDNEVAARVELFEAIRTDRRREQLSVPALASGTRSIDAPLDKRW